MANRRRLSYFLATTITTMTSLLAGCGGVNTFNVQNPGPPPSNSHVSVVFQPAPAGSISINAIAPITAVVNNDPSNAGVDWAVTCQSAGNCGSLSSLHTASGQATTYTPPPTLTGNSVAVTIVAFATADHSQNVVAPFTISAFGNVLKGAYVLQVQGIDSSLNPYQLAGVIVLDGNGGITSGEQTMNVTDPITGLYVCLSDTISRQGSSYFIGADGRGTITIALTNDPDIGVETFSIVALSGSQALVTALPTTTAQVSGTGTMDLQTAVAAPSNGYAFVVSGTDFSSASPTAIGGILNIDSPNTISGKHSVTDQNLAGTLVVDQKLSGTISNPDAFGAVTLNLSVPTFPSTTAFQFTGYIVDASHIKLIESDNAAGVGALGATAGIAIGQGSATGSFNSFSGTYVFGVLGEDLLFFQPSTAASAGVFTADGSGLITNGYTDTSLLGAGIQVSASFDGRYSLSPPGIGRVRSTFSHISPPPLGGFHPSFIFYLTGNGNPPLVLESANANFANPLFVGAGIAYPQVGPLTFGGDYGFSFTQQNGSEGDGTGQMTANPAANSPLSGAVDSNLLFNTSFDNPSSGTFSAPSANGLFPATLSSQIFEFSPFAADFYIIDPSHGFFVETDLVNANAPSGVVSFGYYAARTPVCAGCP